MLLANSASAQPKDPADLALAETLFREAKGLIDQGQFKEACPKLAESQRLDPAGGTLLLLGLCYEGNSQWASAWTAFNDALASAIKDGRKDREDRARERIAVIEPKLARVALIIPPQLSSLPGLRILRDGKELARAAWSSTFPLDPGPHRFEVAADGHQSFRVEIALSSSGGKQEVSLPASLEKTPAPASASASAPPPPATSAPPPPLSASPPSPPTESASSPTRTLAYGLGVVGLLGLGAGTFFGIRAISRSGEANDACPDVKCSDPSSVNRSKDAYRDATISNVGFGVGVVGLGVGVALLLLNPSPKAEASRNSLRVGAAPPVRGVSNGYLRLEGSF